MGDRYFIDVKCRECGYEEEDVYYAPTCGIVSWECPECETVMDLGEYSGISYEDASNLEMMEAIAQTFVGRKG